MKESTSVRIRYVILGVLIAWIAGAIFEASTASRSTESATWRNIGSSAPILFSRNGKVYRFYSECGDDQGRNGCMWQIPIYELETP